MVSTANQTALIHVPPTSSRRTSCSGSLPTPGADLEGWCRSSPRVGRGGMCVRTKRPITDRQWRQLPLILSLLVVLTTRRTLVSSFPLTYCVEPARVPNHNRPSSSSPGRRRKPHQHLEAASTPKASPTDESDVIESKNGDNKAMQFLKKMGKVGGSANRDFRYAIGVDEGSSGKSMGDASKGGSAGGSHSGGPVLRKSQAAYPSCTSTSGGGIIDDLREPFPTTTIGTSWSGFTDQVMGGHSMAVLVRNDQYRGRPANVLTGRVRTLPGQPEEGGAAGFVQMATNLNGQSLSSSYVDASTFDGVEVEVSCTSRSDESEFESFNVHLKSLACLRPFSSYRAKFQVPGNGDWTTVRLPWREFQGHGPGASEAPLDVTNLVRIGIVAIGKPMEVELAVAGLKFYRSSDKA